MRRIAAQARKELTQIRRDRLALVLALALPVGFIALLGTSISLTVTDIPIVIQDLDQTPLSRQYADADTDCRPDAQPRRRSRNRGRGYCCWRRALRSSAFDLDAEERVPDRCGFVRSRHT